MAKKIVLGVVVDTKDAEGSIQRLTDHLNDLRQEGRGTKEDFIKLENEIERLSKTLDDTRNSSNGLLDNLSNMPGVFGKIAGGIKGAIGGLQNFITSAKNLKNIGLVSTLTSVASGFGLASGAAATFAAALTATGIGAFVVAIGALIAYFTQTEKGAEQLKVAMSALGAIVSTVGDAFAALIDLDFGGFIRGLTVDLVNNTAATIENADATNKLNDAQRDLAIRSAEAREEIKELNLVAEDTTRTYEERIDAAQRAGDLERAYFNEKLALINEEIRIAEEQINQRRDATDEEKDQLAELKIARAKLGEESLELQTTLNNKLNTLRDQQLNEDKKRIQERVEAEKKAEEEIRNARIKTLNNIESILDDNDSRVLRKLKIQQQRILDSIKNDLDVKIQLEEEYSKKNLDLIASRLNLDLKILDFKQKKEKEKLDKEQSERLKNYAALGRDIKKLELLQQNEIRSLDLKQKEEREKINEDYEANVYNIKRNSQLRILGLITDSNEKEKALEDTYRKLRLSNDEIELSNNLINLDVYYTNRLDDLKYFFDEQKELYKDNQKILDELDRQFKLNSIELEKQYWRERADITREQATLIANIFAGENGLSQALNTSFTNIFDGLISMLETFKNSNSTLLDDTMATLGTIGAAIQAIGDISDAVTEQRLANINTELQTSLNALNAQREAGILSEQQYQDAVFKERVDAYNAEEKLRKKAFEQNKALGIVNAVISTAQAVISAFNAGASLGPAGVVMGPVMAAIAAAAGIAQIAVISSQKYTPGAAPTAPTGISAGVPSVPSVASAGNQQQPNVTFVGTGSNVNTAGFGKFDNINAKVSITEIESVGNTVNVYETSATMGG